MFRSLLSTLCCLLAVGNVLSASEGSEEGRQVLASFFRSSRIFQTAPAEGITLLSSSGTDAYLLDGESEDIVLSYVFIPPSGSSPEQYDIAFSCDETTEIVVTADFCSVTSIVAEIVDNDATAYNSTVTCIASQFPGSISCGLTATPISTNRTSTIEIDDSIRQTASSVYSSEKISINVYGVVVFSTNSGEQDSGGPVIVSGAANSYVLSSYDRTAQGVRELFVAIAVPGAGTVLGSTALQYLSAATVTTEADDYILWYNNNTCSITDASIENSVVVLPSSDTCGVGTTAEPDATPKLGVQFRPYKSGNFTLRMTWNTFGTAQDAYEQSITFRITERAPPVITSIEKQSLYRSVPCDTEELQITAYNVRHADSRAVTVKNSDDSTTVWLEVTAAFAHNPSTDTSVMLFESGGGLGTDIPFTFQVYYDTTEVSSVVLNSSLSTTLSFSTPPGITNMAPTNSPVDGGKEIVLEGTFEGFDTEDLIYVGGYTVSGADVDIPNSSVLIFLSPALTSLGQPFTYDISVGICAETSNSFTLSYEVSPSVTIVSVDSDVDETGSYIIPSDGSASFLAEVSGNNDGTEYVWKLYTSKGDEVNIADTATNSQLLSVSYTLLDSTSEVYNLTCLVTNSLELADVASVAVKLAESGVEYLLVSVYGVEELSRSVDTVTLIQSSVQLISDSSSVSTLASSEIELRWNYGGELFTVDNSSVDGSVTGPTQLGLEFNIARKDLLVGETTLELIVTFVDKPEVTGRGSVVLSVLESSLAPRINNGVNGSLILTGNDLILTAANSSDPDVVEGDSTAGLSYSWFSCIKSLRPTFSSGVEDCTSIIPSDTSSVEITIPADSLSAARLDTQPDPDPTYFSFGVRISKGERSSEQYAYFELRTVAVDEQVPELSSLQAVDLKGVPLQEFSVFRDIIIQPESDDPFATWAYDMVLPSQKFLFSKNGVFKTGTGFTSARGVKSRDLLGFVSGSLDPSTDYRVSVKASTVNSSLEAEYELSFRTEDVPSLICVPPEETNGTVSETRFVIGGQLSFEAQNIEYCFYLVSSTGKRYGIGKGCSPVQFAEFSFPYEGEYTMECLAKSVTGATIDNVTLSTPLVLATPTPSPDATQIEIVTSRIADLNSEVTLCETLRDHTCLEALIAVATDITSQVSTLIETDSSAEALELFDACKEYIARLSVLSEALAQRTVYRPNQVEDSLNQALYMSQVSSNFVDSEATLFGYMKPAENAVNSTTSESSMAIIGNEVVDTVSAIANLTLATSYSMSQEGSARTRLRRTVGVTRITYGAVQNTVANFIVQMRAQQETCGYVGSESTKYPENLEGSGRSTSSEINIPPIEVQVKVACTREQMAESLVGTHVEFEILCNDILGETEVRRVVLTVVAFPDDALMSTGLISDVVSYVDPTVLINVEETLTELPSDCFRIQLRRKPNTLSESNNENLTVGFLRNIPDLGTNCLKQECYTFEQSGTATFGSSVVVVHTNDIGLLVAGNYTGRAPPLLPPDGTLEGFGEGAGQVVRMLMIGVAFVVAAVVVIWLAVSNACVSSSPETGAYGDDIAAGTMWEYVERDLFGREAHLKGTEGVSVTSISESQLAIPKGASPPGTGMPE